MLAAVTLVKIAGILSLLIVGWVAWRAVRGRIQAPEGEPRPDTLGPVMLKALTAMLMLGVGSVMAISVAEIVQAL